MTDEDWIERLKQARVTFQRCELVSQPDCPEFLIKLMVSHDTEESVIQAGINNPNCTNEIKTIGQKRLASFVKEETGTLCPIMWNHLAVQQNGDLRQCCQMVYPPFGKFFDEQGKPLTFSKENADLARNHPETKQIRKEMMEGKKPAVCKLCWTEEDSGITSKRLNMLKKFRMSDLLKHTDPDGTIDLENVSLSYLDLRLGNLCNLRCRSCGPADSSLWVEDYAELRQTPDSNVVKMNFYGEKEYDIVKTHNRWKIDSTDFEWYADQKFHDWLDNRILNGLTVIYFTGGEPTVNKNHMKILERIIELDKARNISLEYNSNMVAIPPQLLDLWRHFSNVGIGASIDAIGPLATYVRNPSKWNEVEKNCDKVGYRQLPNVHLGLATTISVFNVLHFIDVTKWLLSKKYTSFKKWPSWHILDRPEFFSIQTLPLETKKHIANVYQEFYEWVDTNMSLEDGNFVRNYYSGITNFMNKEQNQHLLPKQKKHIERMDKLRNETIETAIPWLSDVLSNI